MNNAGNELDAYVAKYVMGISPVLRVADEYVRLTSSQWDIPIGSFASVKYTFLSIPAYSTDYREAYWVMQKCLRHEKDAIKERFIVELARIIAGRDYPSSTWSWRDIRLMLGTRPEDICHAALMAVAPGEMSIPSLEIESGENLHVDHS